MLAVIMVHNFDHEVVTTLFESEEDARDYHKWLYSSKARKPTTSVVG